MGIYSKPLLLALGALAFGAAGSAWIARHRRGTRAAASYTRWAGQAMHERALRAAAGA